MFLKITIFLKHLLVCNINFVPDTTSHEEFITVKSHLIPRLKDFMIFYPTVSLSSKFTQFAYRSCSELNAVEN